MNLKEALDRAISAEPSLLWVLPSYHYIRHDIAQIGVIAQSINPTIPLDAIGRILIQYPFGNVAEQIRQAGNPKLNGLRAAITAHQNTQNQLNAEMRSLNILTRSPISQYAEQ
jgi:hypothetical protein